MRVRPPTAAPLGPTLAPPGARGALPAPSSGTPATSTDERATELMALLRDRDSHAAFQELYDSTLGEVTAWVCSLLRQSPAHLDASELVQDTFINVYRYRASFQDVHGASFRVWVRTIAANLVRRARRQAGLERLQQLPEGPAEPADPARGPAQLAWEGEQAQLLCSSYILLLTRYAQAFARLGARDRRALELVELEGVSYAEAAALLSVRPANMKMIVFRARRRLHGLLLPTLCAKAAA